MYIKSQKFLVLGVSKSGYAVAKHILDKGGQCYLYEELSSPKIDEALKLLTSLGAMRLNEENLDKILLHIDILVISPGVPINHEIAIKAKNLGKRIIGELEFGCLQFSPPLIAITGTNGKTTTATLVDAIFNEQGIKSALVGNVGVPITSRINEVDTDTICVAEVSSFQLETVYSFCPHISCVLNISPDHLERHYTMENYVYLKKRIFKNQRESEYTILNYDDKIVRGFCTEIKSNILYVSTREKVDGAYLLADKLYYRDEFVTSIEDLKLSGEHNVYNTLFAIAIAKLMNVDSYTIASALKNFKGVKHRMELIGTKYGVEFYNDSKATNTASTISAIEGIVKPIILILGGSEKGEKYINLFEKIKGSTVKHVILTGASRYNMLESAGKVGYSNLTLTSDFTTAVKIAKLISEEGDAVLLSPACASFDNFSCFEERGEKFKEIVEGF